MIILHRLCNFVYLIPALWPRDTRSERINRYGVHLVVPECSGFSSSFINSDYLNNTKHISWGWIICTKGWDIVTHSHPNFNAGSVKWSLKMVAWINNDIPHSSMNVITYPCSNLSKTMLVKRPPEGLIYKCRRSKGLAFIGYLHAVPINMYMNIYTCIWFLIDWTSLFCHLWQSTRNVMQTIPSCICHIKCSW